jgi:hypothetical protein
MGLSPASELRRPSLPEHIFLDAYTFFYFEIEVVLSSPILAQNALLGFRTSSVGAVSVTHTREVDDISGTVIYKVAVSDLGFGLANANSGPTVLSIEVLNATLGCSLSTQMVRTALYLVLTATPAHLPFVRSSRKLANHCKNALSSSQVTDYSFFLAYRPLIWLILCLS